MFDPTTQSIYFHLKDIERQVKPRMCDYREPGDRPNTKLRLISVIGLVVLAVPLIPWA